MTEKIRNRTSYLAFKELYRFLCNKPSIEDVVRRVFDMLDARRCFGSIRNANYAKESMELVLADFCITHKSREGVFECMKDARPCNKD